MPYDIRKHHYDRLNSYRNSREFQDYYKAIGGEPPEGELPSLLGQRWEITEDIYDEFLNMLPPIGWKNGAFYMSEFSFADITAKFTQEGDRYYCEHARYPERKTGYGP